MCAATNFLHDVTTLHLAPKYCQATLCRLHTFAEHQPAKQNVLTSGSTPQQDKRLSVRSTAAYERARGAIESGMAPTRLQARAGNQGVECILTIKAMCGAHAPVVAQTDFGQGFRGGNVFRNHTSQHCSGQHKGCCFGRGHDILCHKWLP